MITPRLLLAVGLLLVTAGGAITLHSAYMEGGRRTEPLSMASPASGQVEFRPHTARVHFVSLLLDEGAEVGSVDCVDAHGFPRRELDVQWTVEQDGRTIAGGRLASSPLEIRREDHRAMVFGGFFASPGHVYTVKLRSGASCPGLDAFHPRIEVGLRPGAPMRAYFLAGYALLFLGLGLLAGFTRRKDKGWPYRPIRRRWLRWREAANA